MSWTTDGSPIGVNPGPLTDADMSATAAAMIEYMNCRNGGSLGAGGVDGTGGRVDKLMPEQGGFMGWKSLNGAIAVLRVPAGAKRHQAMNMMFTHDVPYRKVRVSEAEVVEVLVWDKEKKALVEGTRARSTKWDFWYEAGKTVVPDSFDTEPVNCGHGIHLFVL